ncbi:putative disease resistance rpp13-like protein 1 [Fagus crenata]
MEDGVSWIKGVKLVMFITHDHDDCLMINGGFGGKPESSEQLQITEGSILLYLPESFKDRLWSNMAGLGGAIQVLLEYADSTEVREFFRDKIRNYDLLEKLKRELPSLAAVVDDAEEKQNRSAAVRAWLHQLRDDVYDAEDFMDVIRTEALRHRLETGSQTKKSPVADPIKTVVKIAEPLSFHQLDPSGNLEKGIDSSFIKFKEYLTKSSPVGNLEKGIERTVEEIVNSMVSLAKRRDELGLTERIGYGAKQSPIMVPSYFGDDNSEVVFALLSQGLKIASSYIAGEPE